MKNYYDLLGIEKTADQQQIKRAYFGLVRQYPPERFPEEFKELRAAYETLSDEEKRAEYDRIGAIPEAVADLFHYAQKANRVGRHADASDLYHLILKRNPELTKVREEQARSLVSEGKSGKAAEVWEILCKQEPDNPKYAAELAYAYHRRSWRKKAIDQFRRALELDNSNADWWATLITYYGEAEEWGKAKETCRQAVAAVKGKNSGSVSLYTYAFMFEDSDDGDGDAEDYLKNIIALMRTESDHDKKVQDVEHVASLIMNKIQAQHLSSLFPYLQEIVNMMPERNKKFDEHFEQLKIGIAIESLEEKGFSELYFNLLALLYKGLDSKDERNELLAMEWTILSKRTTYFPQLLRLKTEYPLLYALHEAFFNEALSTQNPEKMIHQREKMFAKRKIQPIGFSDDDEDMGDEVQTVRREGPKVGRNDPCPCGSGKKYKKCCGA